MRCAWPAIFKVGLGAAAVLVALGCGKARPRNGGTATCESFNDVVKPVLAESCVSCHGPNRAEGGYRLDSREEALVRREDGSMRVSLTDPAVLAAARGELAGHSALDEDKLQILSSWVNDCHSGPGQFKWHDIGWSTPADPLFHGAVLRRDGYALASCQRCHGEELTGGAVGVSCTQCHAQGVLACTTCHGASTHASPPRDLSGSRLTTSLGVGAHQSHSQFSCDACHPTVEKPEDDGHYQRAGVPEDGIAEVRLKGAHGSEAVWDRETATCSNSACHAPASDTAATLQLPTWTRVGQGQGACGTCHGNPPASHTDNRCETCHAAAFANGQPVPGKHANGIVEIGNGTDGCGACHGDSQKAISWRDAAGRTNEQLVTVGAHRAHVASSREISAQMTCLDCHRVPQTLHAEGHIDSVGPAEVFPALSGVATLARTDSAAPLYSSGTCTDSYCHGGGARGAQDTAPGILRSVSWTGGPSQLFCGSCHGLPPQTPTHPASPSLAACANCHPSTVTAQGAIKSQRDPLTGVVTTSHLNGQVEVVP